MNRLVSFYILLATIIGVGIVFYRVMARFLLPLFLAAILVVIFRPLHGWMVTKFNGRNRLAAASTTVLIMLIVLIPLGWVFTIAGIQSVSLISGFDTNAVQGKISKVRQQLKLESPYAKDLHFIEQRIHKLLADSRPDNNQVDAPLSNQERTQLREEAEKQILRLEEKRNQDSQSSPAGSPPTQAAKENRGIRKTVAATLLERLKEVEQLSTVDLQTDQHEGLMKRVQLAFRHYRQDVFGGPILAWVIQNANPSSTDLMRWRDKVLTNVQSWALSITGATTALFGNLLLGTFILIIGVYYFLSDGPSMVRTFMRLSPLDDRYELELLNQFDSISRAVVLATLLTALAQGLLAGIGFYFAGFQSVIMMMFLTMVLSLIPFVGAAAVWIPSCIWLLAYENRVLAAILLALYCVIVVSTVDNIIKPLVLHGRSNLHPLLALLSVLGGVTALGPIGLLVGPMLVTFLQALLNMLHEELSSMNDAPT